MADINCTYCGTALNPSSFSTVRCARCGAVHHSDGTVINPRMLPAYASIDVRRIEDRGERYVRGEPNPRISPWTLPPCRPLVDGFYDVRFRELEPKPLVLWWDNAQQRFLAYHNGHRVRERTLLTWRGSWA